jgi:predicted acetyltransferase
MTGQLTELQLKHAPQLEEFLAAFDGIPDEFHAYFCPRDARIEQAVHSLASWAKGEELGEGWVPCSTWFWEEDGALQGVINVRHKLSANLERIGGHVGYCVAPAFRRRGVATRMLSAVLVKCREIGIERALLTCDSDNTASRKVIEAHGGVLDREELLEPENLLQRWYWIDLTE